MIRSINVLLDKVTAECSVRQGDGRMFCWRRRRQNVLLEKVMAECSVRQSHSSLRLKVPPYMSCRCTYISSSQQEETITTPSPWFPGESMYKCMAHATQYDDVEEI